MSRILHHSLPLWICCLGLLITHSAGAQMTGEGQTTRTRDPARARQLFEKGRQSLQDAAAHASNKHEIEAACQYFEDSLLLDRTQGALKGLANCRSQQDRIATAYALYQAAADLARNQGDAKHEKEARQLANKLADFRSFLTIGVQSSAPDLAIQLDDSSVGRSEYNEAIPIDAGEHRITASQPGHKPFQNTVNIGISEQKHIDVAVLEVLPAPPAPPVLPPPPVPALLLESPLRPSQTQSPPTAPIQNLTVHTNPWPWFLGGAGAVAAVIGGVSGALALHDNSTMDSLCHNTSPCSDNNATSLKSRRNAERTLAWATLPLGIAALGAAATWLLLDGAVQERPKLDSHTATFNASADAHGGALWFGGGF